MKKLKKDIAALILPGNISDSVNDGTHAVSLSLHD